MPKANGELTRKEKAQALVDAGIVYTLKEAYCFLEDMGE
jgi:hypothetical protein